MDYPDVSQDPGTEGPAQVAVVGAGLMGHGIAQAFAQKDCSVALFDLDASILEKALAQIRGNLAVFRESGTGREVDIERVLSRIRISTDLQETVREVSFVVEAAPENLALKTDIFEALDRYAPPEAILASNTSTFPISEIGKKTSKKERLIITHWFNPTHIIPVVEVVRGEATSQEVFDTTYRFLQKIGKRPIRVLKEISGFLINRIQAAMFREILSLLQQGVVEPEDLDRGVQGSFGLRLAAIGPLATGDMGGLDLWCKGMSYLYPLLDRSVEVQPILKEKVARGELGLKTGKGFFQYKPLDAQGLSAQSRERDQKLLALLKTLSERS